MNVSSEFQDLESICNRKLSHVPSKPTIVPSLCGMLSRESLRPGNMEFAWYIGKRFWQSTCSNQFVIDSFSRKLHSWNTSAFGGNSVRDSTGTPVARSEERNRETIPTPRKTINSLFPAEGTFPQNYVAGQQRLQISELQFDKFPTPSTLSCWKIKFKTQVSTCSSSPLEAMLWIKEVEMVDSVDDLKSSRSIQGCFHFPNFEMLDARFASALNKIIQNFYIKKQVSVEEQNAQKEEIGSFAEDRSPA